MTDSLQQTLSATNILSTLVNLQNKSVIQQFNDDEINLFRNFQRIVNDDELSRSSETRSQLPAITSILLVVLSNFIKGNEIHLKNSALAAQIEKHRKAGIITNHAQIIEFSNTLIGAINLTQIVVIPTIIGISTEQKNIYLEILDGLKKGIYSQVDVMNLMSSLQSAAYKLGKATSDEFIKEKLKAFDMENVTVAPGMRKFSNDVKKYIRIILELNGIQAPPEEA